MPGSEITEYVAAQVNHFYPDKHSIRPGDLFRHTARALERVEYCFGHCNFPAYCRDGQARFNHLHSDQYLVFLWYLSNTVWQADGSQPLADKLYCLNKTLHGFDCLYDSGLPDIFLVFHGVGTVLGKAMYNNFFSVSHGCTVGNQHGEYPRLDEFVALTARASVIGRCHLAEGATVGAGTVIFNTHVAARHAVYRDRNGVIQQRPSEPHAEWVFSRSRQSSGRQECYSATA